MACSGEGRVDETILRKDGWWGRNHRGRNQSPAERDGGRETFQSGLLSLMSSEELIQLTDQETDGPDDTHRLYPQHAVYPGSQMHRERASGSGWGTAFWPWKDQNP